MTGDSVRFVSLNAIVSFRWTRSFRFAERDRFLSPMIVSLEIFRFLILLILVLTLAGKYYMKGKKMKTFYTSSVVANPNQVAGGATRITSVVLRKRGTTSSSTARGGRTSRPSCGQGSRRRRGRGSRGGAWMTSWRMRGAVPRCSTSCGPPTWDGLRRQWRKVGTAMANGLVAVNEPSLGRLESNGIILAVELDFFCLWTRIMYGLTQGRHRGVAEIRLFFVVDANYAWFRRVLCMMWSIILLAFFRLFAP